MVKKVVVSKKETKSTKSAKKSAKIPKKPADKPKRVKPVGKSIPTDLAEKEIPTGKPPVKKPKKGKRRPKGVASVSPHTAERETKYPSVTTRLCIGERPLTASLAKKLLGWEEEGQVPFGGEYVRELKRYTNTKVRLYNDLTNRAIRPVTLDTLKQEILRKKWRFNGETIIISKTGMIHDGQHTLIALVLAAQEWHENREKWETFWEEEPRLEKLIVFGIEEDDETINTIGTGIQRTLADVMFRSPYFRELSHSDHKRASRIASFAIQFLWKRTGASLNAYSPRRTHSESVSFLERHERALEAVTHIYQEDGTDKLISKFIQPGYAAGLLYLMGTSSTNPDDYRASDSPSEEMLDFKNWDKACGFFVALAQDSAELKALRDAIIKSREGESTMTNGEIWALFCKAWECFVEGKSVTPKAIALSYYEDDNGFKKLDECPVTGGIDLGDPKEADETLLAQQGSLQDPTEEEIKERKKEVTESKKPKREKLFEIVSDEAAKGKLAKHLKKHLSGDSKFGVGEVVWISPEEGEPFRGKIVEAIGGKNYKVKIYTGFKGAGNIVPALMSQFSSEQPKIAKA